VHKRARRSKTPENREGGKGKRGLTSGSVFRIKGASREEYTMPKKKKATVADTEQTLIAGVMTEDEVFRRVMRKIGRKGGSVRSEAQTAARRKCMAALNEKKRAAREAKREQEP
jgi:hypothetical protein